MASEPDLTRLVEQVEIELLGGQRRYTRSEVAERSGLDVEEVQMLWRALGFATSEDSERIFTDSDVAALRDVRRLRELGGIDADGIVAMTRMIGQTFARLASWQGQLVVDAVAADPHLLEESSADGVIGLVGQVTQVADQLHSYVWRRQLAANFSRIASNSGAELGTESAMAVGFADMAGFTSFTRRSSEADLRAVLGAFEALATDVIAANRGQLVKTIGDEVLFTAESADAAGAIGLGLLEAAALDDTLPQMRAGLAFGPVVNRLGDVYGQTVNIASRLTSAARNGTVLVDRGMFEGLTGDERFGLSALRPMSVRGYQHLRSWRLRRVAPGVPHLAVEPRRARR